MNPLALNPKKKAVLFATALLLVSTILLGSAVATTNSAIQPFLRGEGFAQERSLTRGHHVSLALFVGAEREGTLQPLPSAMVSVRRVDAETMAAAQANASVGEAPLPPVLVEKTTDERGVAIFDLKPGHYWVTVSSTAGEASKDVTLRQGLRLNVAFDAEGTPHWDGIHHRDLERRGEHRRLMVRVGEAREGQRPAPLEGATVSVQRVGSDNTTEPVGEKRTGPRGFADFVLPRGTYLIRLETNQTAGELRIELRGDVVVGAIVDGNHVEWRRERPDAHDFQRPPPRHGGPRSRDDKP